MVSEAFRVLGDAPGAGEHGRLSAATASDRAIHCGHFMRRKHEVRPILTTEVSTNTNKTAFDQARRGYISDYTSLNSLAITLAESIALVEQDLGKAWPPPDGHSDRAHRFAESTTEREHDRADDSGVTA